MQRSDDTEEKARNRLRTYHANVDAVVGYYKNEVVEVRACFCVSLMPACRCWCMLGWMRVQQMASAVAD